LDIPEEELLRTALTFFIHANNQYPATPIAQGATIALLCNESGQNPDQLKMAMLAHPEKLEELTRITNNRHRKIKEANPESRVPEEVSERHATEMMAHSVILA
jgi:hypothetical protein